MAKNTVNADILGQLLFLQSTLDVMPEKQGIIDLVCEGLTDVPSVISVSYMAKSDKPGSSHEQALTIPISSRQTDYGALTFNTGDSEEFAKYRPHIQNVANSIALVFDNRGYISKINQHREQLENRVKERTAELEESEINFRNLAESDFNALVVHKDFRLLYANPAAQKIFNDQGIEQMLGRSVLDFVHPCYRDFARLSVQRLVRRKEKIPPVEIKALTSSGQKLDIEIASTPIRFDESPAVLSIVHDITEHKQAEQNLYESEKKYRGMIMNLVEGFYRVTLDGKLQDYNVAFTKILGLDPNKDYTGIELPDFWQNLEDRKNYTKKIKTHGFIKNYMVHAKKLNGEKIVVLVNARLIKSDDGDPLLIEGAFLDITERKQADALVLKLSQAMEQAGESIVITDREGVLEYANPAFTKLTGYTTKEVVGKTPRILKGGGQKPIFYENMWNTILNGDTWHGKVIDKRKDGKLFPCMLSIAPISNNDGVITHFVGTHADISELEDMEQQFHQAQKMEALGTLVGGIAHDFNNMLAGMTGNLYLAKKKVMDNPDVVQKLSRVEVLSQRAADMIQQLLTFARKGQVNMKQIPLNPFIKETLKFLHTSVPENIALHHDVCSDPLLIDGDATQLHQVLMNLINNACDAVENVDEPCITIRLESFQPDGDFIASHSYFNPIPYARLCVEDNGCGIPEHHIKHLFEPFFTTKEQGKGTGLGLAMVFGAIKTHHGYVEVESIEGEGTTFHIYLPLLEIEEIASTPLEDEVIVEGSGETILLVDDEPNILEVVGEVLESLGYRVLKDSNGLGAIETFTAYQDIISLIIMDIVMPKLGGVKAVERIRKINPDIKVIFATGYDKDASLPDAIPRGDIPILSKPYNIEELSKIIRKQLES